MQYRRFEGETDQQLIYRVCGDKELIGSWQDVADILNEILGTHYTESKFRKSYKAFVDTLEDNKEQLVESSSIFSEFELQKRELERERIKFRDERRAWSKQNYIDSRVEEKLDLLEEQLLKIGRINFESHDIKEINSDNDVLVILSDFHIGANYKSITGEYNINIARERLSKLLSEVIKIQKRHNSEKCYLSLQGDLISGNIHKNIQVTNSENVIEQIKIATELICGFAYEISKYFTKVFISSVSGNHSRIDKKEDSLHSERLDDLILWGTKLCLNGVENIHILERNIDNGIVDLNIRGKTYLAVHGDFDSYSNNGVSNLCMMLGFLPFGILYGHLHTCAVDESHGVKMIRGGSLGGSGDDYTLEKRLSGKASQMVCVCDNNGVVCYYPIELN